MNLPSQKTKIVATIGPTSDSPEVLERMIRAGMNVARLNFSHGDFTIHAERIKRIRAAEAAAGRPVAIMADLPGPKMRLGKFLEEPVVLSPGDPFLLTARDIEGHRGGASMSFEPLPRVVKPGDRLYLNDGLVQLIVERVDGLDVHCITAVGGELRSKKGLNLPGIDLGIGAFTVRDRDCLEFALSCGVDAVSQSFVRCASDIHEVREAARALGKSPFVIAKIERSDALDNLDELVEAADGLMVARGDLGVEVPIERIALIQKQIIAKANAAGKPVITATHMLESMISSRLPTRAEATDVANAILDGTDCIMLSGESAMGRFPVESVAMLASIAASAEIHRDSQSAGPVFSGAPMCAEETLSEIVQRTLQISPVTALFVPTLSGSTARKISRFKPRVWVVALSPNETTCRGLAFSYGVHPIFATEEPEDWMAYTANWLEQNGLPVRLSMLVVGPSRKKPDTNIRIEFLHVLHPPSGFDLNC